MLPSVANHCTPSTMSQLLSSTTNTSVENWTPYIFQRKFLHTWVQVIWPPFAASTANGRIEVRVQLNLFATWVLIKLCVLPESIMIKSGDLSTLPVTLRVWKPEVPSKALMDIWGVKVSGSISLPSWTSSPTTSSSSKIHREYTFLFLHQWPGMNFSSHQKHNPFALLSSNSLFLRVFVGL